MAYDQPIDALALGLIEIVDEDDSCLSVTARSAPRPDVARPGTMSESLRRAEEQLQNELAQAASYASPTPADLSYDYSLPPGRREADLIRFARQRVGIIYSEMQTLVSRGIWSVDDASGHELRETMIPWRSDASVDDLLKHRWPELCIAVWCYPYAYDVHLSDTNDPRHAAAKCLELLADTRRPPMGTPTGCTTVESATEALASPAAPAKRTRSRELSDQVFRQRLEDAGRRLLTGDASGTLTDRDRKLIATRRKLTKTAVYGLVGCGKTAFEDYLTDYRVCWETWKIDIERKYRSR